MMNLQLKQEWDLGALIDGGGFGEVYEAISADGIRAAVKLIPKERGAQREMLFVDLSDARNVIPIIDDGETDNHWILVMPRAEKSLRKHLDDNLGPLPVADSTAILIDIAESLVDLNGRVVHRDLKPQNILLLNGRWCLADFGISRYAEATTAPDTRRFAFTPLYAAPESWRYARPTAATDVYSVGVIAYELLSGSPPFDGADDLRRQHLEDQPPELTGVPAGLKGLVDACLYKAPEARPTPNDLLARLQRAVQTPPSAGLARLQQANQANVGRIGELNRQESMRQSLSERRSELARSATQALSGIAGELRSALLEYAPSASVSKGLQIGWTIQLNTAEMHLSDPVTPSESPWEGAPPHIDVISFSSLSVTFPAGRDGYTGRSHSLWYCDAQQAGEYHWYETAFMFNPFTAHLNPQDPFARNPDRDSAMAVNPGLSNVQVAWPFTPLNAGELHEFISRWAGWLADASAGQLRRPNPMPDRHPEGSWRQS